MLTSFCEASFNAVTASSICLFSAGTAAAADALELITSDLLVGNDGATILEGVLAASAGGVNSKVAANKLVATILAASRDISSCRCIWNTTACFAERDGADGTKASAAGMQTSRRAEITAPAIDDAYLLIVADV